MNDQERAAFWAEQRRREVHNYDQAVTAAAPWFECLSERVTDVQTATLVNCLRRAFAEADLRGEKRYTGGVGDDLRAEVEVSFSRGRRPLVFLSVRIEEAGRDGYRTYGFAHIGSRGAISRRTKDSLYPSWSTSGRSWR